ncbi:TetR/AcrR family transcriptional regulator [Bacillaceae bacterium W0354]
MPKITFHNLTEEKKQILMNAIKSEFSRVPLNEALISNIIKSARIARGSFYQYFEDKEDAFYYLLEEYAKERKKNFVDLLINERGNLFKAVIQFYHHFIQQEKDYYFLKNIFTHMNYKVESHIATIFSANDINGSFKEINALIDRSILNVTCEKELFHALQVISAITSRNIVLKYAVGLSNEEALENFKSEMQLLQNGIGKN